MCLTDMIDMPVSKQKYAIYDIDVLPKTLLCIAVKNKFDEMRLTIKNKYSPKRICHFENVNDQLRPVYYYGIELNIRDEYQSMISKIGNKQVTDLEEYNSHIEQYGLSCSTCYGYYSDSVWPIDIKHLQKITKRDFSSEIKHGLTNMIKSNKTDTPYISLPNFNILTLSKSIEYDN